MLKKENSMRTLYAWTYAYIVLWGCAVFSAVHDGNLYIKNEHTVSQFECMYTAYGQTKGPIVIYKDEVNLGPIASITDIQIKRYGKLLGIGASYYSFPEQLSQCKSQPDRNWVLHITGDVSWDVEAKLREQPAKGKDLKQPLDYFPKASGREDKAQPRYLFDLPELYTQKQIAERLLVLTEQVKQADELSPILKQQIVGLLNDAADYAHRLLDPKLSAQIQEKLTLEWRGKLHPERVVHGKEVACILLSDQPLNFGQQDQYLRAIIDLIWFFYDQALAKNQVFEEGTYIIQDPQNRFYDFLVNYLKMVNPSIKDTLADPALKVSTNTFAYSRLSSHFKLEQEQFRHYGIDMRFNALELARTLLPVQKTHILFGHIRTGLLFIKPETVGIALQSIPIHTADFVTAQLRKPGLKAYFNAYLPTYIDDLLNYYIGTDDNPNWRKERIPQELLEKCLDILKSEKLTDEQISSLMYRFSTKGIHGVYREIRNAASPLTQAQKIALNEYLEQLRKDGLDHQQFRYGREVVFTHDELAQHAIKILIWFTEPRICLRDISNCCVVPPDCSFCIALFQRACLFCQLIIEFNFNFTIIIFGNNDFIRLLFQGFFPVI